MALPLARNHSRESQIRPNAESWKKLVETAGRQLESLEYLEQAAAVLLKKEGLLKEYDGLMHELTQMVANARFQDDTKASPWLGDAERLSFNQTDFSLFHRFLASENAKAVVALFAEQPEGTENVMNYAISETGEYIRNFTLDDAILEGDSLSEMDALFNAWLVENNMINSDGVIYERTDSGEIQRDQNGAPKVVNSEQFKETLHSQNKGLEPYVQRELRAFLPDKKTDINFVIKGHDYVQPEATPKADEPRTAQEM